MLRILVGLLKWTVLALVALVVVLLLPIGYVETFCRADPDKGAYAPLITDAAERRAEANSYLAYPEWHIVYAYQGLAHVLESEDEHAFRFGSSILGFWRSFCAVNARAGRRGGGDFADRARIHAIGTGFTLEMMLKGVYEESVGRLFAALRGARKSPQDRYVARVTADYATFLGETPRSGFDFDGAVDGLWSEPLSQPIRGWERRLAVGAEWRARSAYGGAIVAAVDAGGQATSTIRSVVAGVTAEQLLTMRDVIVVEEADGHIVIETPRRDRFTEIIQGVVAMGGEVVEIAGNDEIMVSILEFENATGSVPPQAILITRVARDGYNGSRVLAGVRLGELDDLIAALPPGGRSLEHIYDY